MYLVSYIIYTCVTTCALCLRVGGFRVEALVFRIRVYDFGVKV